MIGEVTQTSWRTIAADIDGIPQPDLINQVRTERQALFAYLHEARQWLADQAAEGFTPRDGWGDGIGSAAVSYFGPTDAPGNCWSATVEKLAAPDPAPAAGPAGPAALYIA